VIPVRYLDAAEQEILEAIAYLENRAPGLGVRLYGEIQRAEKLISQFPLATSEIRPAVRRALLRKFPYALIYSHMDRENVILAVSHPSRQPGYWDQRRP
jgi:plasmid stabilization system protein ParE